jgi:hypothetical protein
MIFTEAELPYLRSQRLGRLATVAADGFLQNNPVGFVVGEAAGVINIGGIHPRRIISWGLGPDGTESSRRTVGGT